MTPIDAHQNMRSLRSCLTWRNPAFAATTRNFWQWLNFVFNRVDHSRVAAVGPDRAAAEWVLRLGGSVKFTTLTHWSSDYNRLPSEPLGYLRVEAIDVSEISITDNGLEHLDGLEVLSSLKMKGCQYITDVAMSHLRLVRGSLTELDVSHCHGISAAGLHYLHGLSLLQRLNVQGTVHVSDRERIMEQLQQALPKCKISS